MEILDQTYHLGSKIRHRERAWGGGVGWQPPPKDFFTYFSNHEDDIQSQQIWYEVR